jgi:hypothetical protein
LARGRSIVPGINDRPRGLGPVLPVSFAMKTRHCGDGYRFAKRNGKSIFTNAQKPLRHRHFLHFLSNRFSRTFTSRSSRYLNCPSKFSGHITLNKPANGSA